MNNFGDALRSSIFTGVALAASWRSLSCSTADGLADGIAFLLVAFRSSFLKSFNDVLGEPMRSPHVVDRASLWRLFCKVGCVVLDALLLFALPGIALPSFNGVDVLNVDCDLLDLAEPVKLMLMFDLVGVLRFGKNFDFFGVLIRFSQEKRRFGTFGGVR